MSKDKQFPGKMDKTTERKYKQTYRVGYKKLKHVKLFEEFSSTAAPYNKGQEIVVGHGMSAIVDRDGTCSYEEAERLGYDTPEPESRSSDTCVLTVMDGVKTAVDVEEIGGSAENFNRGRRLQEKAESGEDEADAKDQKENDREYAEGLKDQNYKGKKYDDLSDPEIEKSSAPGEKKKSKKKPAAKKGAKKPAKKKDDKKK